MKKLLRKMKQKGYLKSKRIAESFKDVDRKDFILPGHQREVYGDYPLFIGYGQTISQPSTVSFMLELLAPKREEKVLDVGSGSGWTTALLAHIVGPKGKVFGVEMIPELVEFSRENLEKYDFKHAEILEAEEELGLPSKAPFDKILVSASADLLPQKLVDQLKERGKMVIPVQNSIYLVRKMSGGEMRVKEFFGFSFVPLI